MTQKGNIVLIGPMGAGKTTLGRKLAQHFKTPFIDIDEEIEKRLGVDIARIFDTEGEAGFRQREKIVIEAVLAQYNDGIIATGGGCILTPEVRQIISKQRLIVHVDVSLSGQYHRLKYDNKRPILQGGNLRQKLQILRQARHEIYKSMADIHLLTDSSNFKTLVNSVQSALDK